MITWLLVAELLCQAEGKMSEMLKERMERYPISGEINSTVADAKTVMAAIEENMVLLAKFAKWMVSV